MKTNIKNMKVKGTSLILIILMLIGMMPQLATPVYAADPVYDITFYHSDWLYGEGDIGHLKGSSTDWEHPTWGNDAWAGSARLRPKAYYEAGNDYFTLKVAVNRLNGAHQPDGNYVSGTVKYKGHTITFKNYGPFWCGNWADIRFERTAITFNYNGGRNYNQNTDNITVDYYWYNGNNFSIVDTYNGKIVDTENQPWWEAYPPLSSNTIFGGWWTEPTGGTRITTEDITKLSGIMTLYAHWEPYYLVDLVGGSNVTPSRGKIDSYGHHETKVVQGSAMEPVIFTAKEGYHIDHNSINDVMGRREGSDVYTHNGVTVERISDTHYVASGTPTGQVHIWIPNGHKYEDWTTTTAATCTTAGEKERVCKYDATIKETAEVDIDPNAHSYKFKDFTWTGNETDGYTAAVANYVCEHDASHTTTGAATVSSTVTAPTCTEGGKTTYTATVAAADSLDGTEHTESKDAKPTEATDHDWTFTEFTWTGSEAGGYTAATANYVCEHDASHTTTAPAAIGEPVVTDPICTEPGKTTYTATVAAADSPDGQAHEESKDAKATEPTDHDWTFTEFTWTGSEAGGYTAATANYVCENDDTHTNTVNATINAAVTDHTCTEPGKTTYTATVAAADSLDGTEHTESKDAKPTEAIEHKWAAPTYTWSADNKSVTATRVCANDASHVETETAETTSEVTKAATCTEKGKTTYTATFTNKAFAEQTKTAEDIDIDSTAHEWGDPIYTWASDNKSVTAARVCAHSATHYEMETADATSQETKPATCTEKGETTYASAAFKNAAFAQQTKTVADIDALEHSYKFTEFTWTGNEKDGYTAAVANYVCEHDDAHKAFADATMSENVLDPNCTEPGKTTYTATIAAEGSADGQERTESKDAKPTDPINHNWGNPTFTWAADNRTVTATRVCSNDNSHVDTETATTKAETTAPTCEKAGKTVYTAEFKSSAFETQTKTVDVKATGHKWGAPTYTWSKDNSTVTATRICKNDTSEVDTETVVTTSKITKEATEEEEGETTYTATFTNPVFEKQTKTEVIPKLDPSDDPTDPVDPTPGDDPTDPVDPTPGDDPTDPIDPTPGDDPTDPVDPQPSDDPTDPVDPTPGDDPTDPIDPTSGDDPTDPVDPTPSDDPTDPVDPTPGDDPTDPVDPTPSDDPTDPVNPQPSDDPTDPVDPTPGDDPTDPADPTPSDDPTDPVDPTPSDDPTDPVDPTPSDDPTDPVDPTPSDDPTDPVDPTPGDDPTNPIDPTPGDDPTDPIDPTPGDDPIDPADPTPGDDPTDPVDPTPSDDPTDPVDPTPSDDPTDPVDPTPGDDPTDPVDPTPSGDPTDPADPTPSDDPTDPVDPTPSGDPTDPADPTPSDDPTDPVDPTPSGDLLYRNTEGGGTQWTKDSNITAVFTFKRTVNDEVTFSHFTGIQVDGKDVDEFNYIAEPGSVIIKLRSSYLETLAGGEHTLTAMFNDGNSASAKFTILAESTNTNIPTSSGTAKKANVVNTSTTAPKTGDTGNMLLWLTVLCASMLVLFVAISVCRRNTIGRR